PIGLALRNGRDRPQRVEVELRIPAGDEAIGNGRECGRLEARRRGKVERLLSRDAPNRRGPHGAGERLPEQRAGRLFIVAQGAVFYPEGFDLVAVSNPLSRSQIGRTCGSELAWRSAFLTNHREIRTARQFLEPSRGRRSTRISRPSVIAG